MSKRHKIESLDKLEWHTERRKISDLIPWGPNPRQMTEKQVADLQQSLERFNLMSIPVIDTDNTIISGHQRMKIMQLLGRGEETIDARVPNRKLTDRELEEANLRENKNLGEWDIDLLASFDTELLLDVGWTDEELKDIFQLNELPGGSEGNTDPDAVPDPPVEPKSKTGDLYQLGRHRLMCGDSTKREDVERLMDGERADMVFTSPPYDQQRTYNGKMVDDWQSLMEGVFSNLFIDDHSQIFVNLGLIHEKKVKRYWDLWLEFMEKIGFPLFGWYVWDKLNGMPGDWGGRLAPSHEWIFHFTVNPERPNKIIKCKRAGGKVGSTQRQKDGSLKKFTQAGKPISQLKVMDSVIRLSPQKCRDQLVDKHPAPFPIALPESFFSSWDAQIILDPFGGSGSTLIACEKTGRQCRMIELDPIYCDVIIARWEEYTDQKAEKIG